MQFILIWMVTTLMLVVRASSSFEDHHPTYSECESSSSEEYHSSFSTSSEGMSKKCIHAIISEDRAEGCTRAKSLKKRSKHQTTCPKFDLKRCKEESLPKIPPKTIQKAFEEAHLKIAAEIEIERNTPQPGPRVPLDPSTIHQALTRPSVAANALKDIQQPFEYATLYIKDKCVFEIEETYVWFMNRKNLNPAQVNCALPKIHLNGSPEVREEIKNCTDHFVEECNPSSKYRTADGSCNNLRHPTWGRVLTCFTRLLPPDYGNGVNSPRRSKSGGALPQPRDISLMVHKDVNKQNCDRTHMTMMWGQFLAHDITLSPCFRTFDNNNLRCCPNNTNPNCLSIAIKASDPILSSYGISCLSFPRSIPCPTCRLGPREHLNQQTMFHDGSHVYGSSDGETSSLRTGHGGELAMNQYPNVGALLPNSTTSDDGCTLSNINRICFRAGDLRVNQQPGITVLQTFWARQHNRIAGNLKFRNQCWSDEKTFQIARSISIAQMHIITYKNFLPSMLGPDYTKFFNLKVKDIGYTSYRSEVDPRLHNEFVVAAFRGPHSIINSGFAQEDQNGVKSVATIRNYFQNPFALYTGQMDSLTRGTIKQPSQSFDPFMTTEVTNFLYRNPFPDTSGFDLAAFDVLRGRERGIPGYTKYLKLCFSRKIHDFADLNFIHPFNVARLKKIYKHVEDIDLFTGGLSETPVERGAMGPTFACLVGLQMKVLKEGDRFYVEHGGQAGSFTHDQLQSIRQTTLAKVICENTNVTKLHENVFHLPSKHNKVMDCDQLPDIDWDLWSDPDSDCVPNLE